MNGLTTDTGAPPPDAITSADVDEDTCVLCGSPTGSTYGLCFTCIDGMEVDSLNHDACPRCGWEPDDEMPMADRWYECQNCYHTFEPLYRAALEDVDEIVTASIVALAVKQAPEVRNQTMEATPASLANWDGDT